jgi:hypothetical protein
MVSVVRLTVASSQRRWFVAVLAAVITAALVILVGVPGATVAAAPAAPTVLQCNPAQSFPGTTAGWEVTCNVTIENSITSGTSSTITSTACLTAAGVIPTPADCAASPGYYKTVSNSSQLVTSVNQCNGIATGGGSNIFCDVTVINDIPAGTPTSGVTVHQCIGSGTGQAGDVLCVPLGSTSGATVTQCDGSGNGGGTYSGIYAIICTVSGSATALPVTINQCNGSGNGGGTTVTCTATITNNFVTATGPTTTIATGPTTTIATGPTTTTTTGPTTTTTTGPTTTTTTGPTTTTTTGSSNLTPVAAGTGVIPTGAPRTGAGGASHSSDSILLVMGGLALFGEAPR